MLVIDIFSKPDCPLCDHAKEILIRFQSQFPISIREINIQNNQKYFDMYKDKIPVIHLNGEYYCHGRVSEKAFRNKLNGLIK